MTRLLVFGGTTEARELAAWLAGILVDVLFCVASEYGREMLSEQESARIHVQAGLLDAEGMRGLMREGGFAAVIDATHPYAELASTNIRAASETEGVPCWRLLRPESLAPGCIFVGSAVEAAAHLATVDGNILLTTGTKDLALYATIPNFADRCYPRVLPTIDALEKCERLGYRRSHIVAMQGPFGRELNRALMAEFSIRILVTKDGGKEGGFTEKVTAAEDLGVHVIVVGRPAEDNGLDRNGIQERISGLLEVET